MRESRKYLMWMPVKFVAGLGLAFMLWMAFFKYFESQAAAHGPIYAELTPYVFMLSLLPATSGLLAMAENYLDMWSGEVSLERYLRKLGIAQN